MRESVDSDIAGENGTSLCTIPDVEHPIDVVTADSRNEKRAPRAGIPLVSHWHTVDPETGIRNVGNYRSKIRAKNRLGIFVPPHPAHPHAVGEV
jgi:hypothetical protein